MRLVSGSVLKDADNDEADAEEVEVEVDREAEDVSRPLPATKTSNPRRVGSKSRMQATTSPTTWSRKGGYRKNTAVTRAMA